MSKRTDRGADLSDALEYHMCGRAGKIEIGVTKPCLTQEHLALAYTPGVAEPCREIGGDAAKAYDYTAKGNLVAVVTNGTAVLGLGNIGPLAAKPVMEGKSVLFKRFADVDAFDIEVAEADPKKFIDVVASLEPTFGGINLEDIKAPECFEIEQTLIKRMGIPVFHDDQHGTAIITAAALLNALELTGKKMNSVKVVFSGAGAAGIATADLLMEFGLPISNIWFCDRKGLVTTSRKEQEPYRQKFAHDRAPMTLGQVLKDADVFIGVSAGGLVPGKMVKKMASRPIIFAMANPDPEILPEVAKKARPDAIVATGRSDYPNQVNNALGFPYIFRGALDSRAKVVNTEMKKAAALALASLAKEPVPGTVLKAYSISRLGYGPDYLIPKPLDPRLALHVSLAVAQAATKSGVAKRPITDIDSYRKEIDVRMKRMLG